LYQEDRTKIIARGQISVDRPEYLDGIHVSSTRTVINVDDIYVPGAIMTVHHGRPLSSFGTPPFTVVCKQRQVYSFVESFAPPPVAVSSPETQSAAAVDTAPEPPPNPDADEMPTVDQTMDRLSITFSNPSAATPSVVQSEKDSAIDTGGLENWDAFLREMATQPWPTQTRSRVLKDIFHVFQMIIIPKNHGLRVKFSRALRDAIFLPDATDKKRIESYLARLSPPMTFVEKLQSNPSWIKKHCKHVVPPPEKLSCIVSGLFRDYGPLKDAQKGFPLFNTEAWQTAKKILELIRKGYISDPPGVALYYCIGICKKTGLPIYRDWRGTTLTEGGVHRPIRHSLPIGGVSVRHTSNRLADFVFHHNMLVCMLLISYWLTRAEYHFLSGWYIQYDWQTISRAFRSLGN
jgi:hypothetical protein